MEPQSIKFWLNAFIPKEIPTGKGTETYTIPIPGRPNETMIPGPYEPRREPPSLLGAVFPLAAVRSPVKKYGYATDQRDFSANITASARVHFEIQILYFLPKFCPFVDPPRSHCSPSIVYDIKSGMELDRAEGHTKVFSRIDLCTDHELTLDLSCEAPNPLVPGSSYTANINFSGSVSVNFAERSIFTHILIDDFPAFEAYATINDGAPASIFNIMPEKGKTISDLADNAVASYLPNIWSRSYGAGIRLEKSRVATFKATDTDRDGVFDRVTGTVQPGAP